MTQYNIIYTSLAHDHYLWNGARFKKLVTDDRVSILNTNRSYANHELDNEFAKCREHISKDFPNDKEPQLNTVGIVLDRNRTETSRGSHFQHRYN